MPWGRLDDSLYDHPKLDLLPDSNDWPDRLAGVGLNTLAVSWCNRFLTDGHVPRNRVEKLGGTIELADKLVDAGLWERAASGYLIHDFLVYNDSRDEVLERRRKEAERKAEWRKAKAAGAKRPAGSPTGTPNGAEPDVPAHVPPSVPPGHVDNPVEMSRDVSRRPSRRVSRESPRANPPARIPARPGPARPNLDRKSPAAGGRARGPQVTIGSTGTEPTSGVTLTKAQLEAWSSFGPEWDAFKAAWLARGFRLPPSGDATDDEGTSQRSVLYPIVSDWPSKCAEWVAEATGKTPRDVVAHVLEQRVAKRAEAGADDVEEWFAGPSREEATETLAAILERMR